MLLREGVAAVEKKHTWMLAGWCVLNVKWALASTVDAKQKSSRFISMNTTRKQEYAKIALSRYLPAGVAADIVMLAI